MPSNSQRIQQLRGLSKLLVLLGLPVFVYLVFFHDSSPIPSEQQEAMRISIADLAPGAHKIVSWKGRQLIVLHRDDAMREAIENSARKLYDAASRLSFQPDYAENQWRFSDPQWLVVVNQSPDTGCGLEVNRFGFMDMCRGSLYDGSGRVLEGQQSKRNLEVPGHRVEDGSITVF